MAIGQKVFVARGPSTAGNFANARVHANKAFLEQKHAECEVWINRIYELLDKAHSHSPASTPQPELSGIE